jgi:type IV pilus assembly protein PilM
MSDEQSIWKKEISFGRNRKDKDAAPEPEAAESAAAAPSSDESTSIWKKEISFGRKKKQAPEREEGQSVSAEPEVVGDTSAPVSGSDLAPGPEEPAQEEPVWTRAVSFSPTPEREPVVQDPVEDNTVVELPVAAAEPEADADVLAPVEGSDLEPGPEEPAAAEETWTKEVSFSRQVEREPVVEKPFEDNTVVELPVAAAEPEADADVLAPVEGSGLEPGPEEPVAAETVVELPVAAAELEADADVLAPVEGSGLEPGPEEPVAAEQTWTKEVSFSRSTDDSAPVAEATEIWSAQPSLPPEPIPAPEVPVHVPVATVPVPAAGIHPPVTADELPPVAEEEKKVPFWKKDISFGGGKKSEAPKEPKAPKAKREKQPKPPKEKKQKEQRAPKVKAARGSKGAKRLVGLKIGASQLAAARVANNGSAELLQVAREPLEAGIVVGGELRDPDALAEALKEFFAKHNLPKKGVRLGIANNRIGVRTFDVAGIDDQKQLTNAVRFRAQEALPIPIDEAVLDFQVLGDGVDQDGQPTKRILLVVAYRELIDRYLDACKKAGITLVGIDLEAFALLRALQAPQEGNGAALVAVAIGHDRSTFAVSDGRVCEFTRVLEWGGSALNVAIARAVDAAPSEVDGVKRALALTDEMVPDGLTADQAKKARDAMRRAIQTFARELVSSLQYYQNQPGSLGIGEIVLTGGTAHLPGLGGELEKLIGVRVRVGDPLARMKVSKKLGETEQVGSLAVAIGLGIED